MMTKAVVRRIRILEVGAGLVETAESRRAREELEILRQRIAAGRVRAGLSPSKDEDEEDLSGLTVVEILNRGRQRARERNFAAHQTAPGVRVIDG